MTTINVNTIAPAGSTLTVGDSGDTIVVPEVKVNTVKDAGGNTLWVSNGSGTLSSVNSGFGGALNLLSTQTADDDASISFTSGIDSTYKEYIFKFINCDGGENRVSFQCSTDGGSNYNTTVTTTFFHARHQENGSSSLGYDAANDLAESTDYQILAVNLSPDADAGFSGELHLFNPASTTYVKNFYSTSSIMQSAPGAWQSFVAGYFNTTSAINAISFKMNSGNMSAGKIKMYGVS